MKLPGTLLAVLLAAAMLAAVPRPADARQADSRPDGAAVTEANYELAARFAPYKISDYLYSTSVYPRWIEGTEKFWYEWETSDGTEYRIADPERGMQRQIFDNDRLAAELTRITRDPYDGQNLPVRSIRFVDGNTLRFDVESSQDEEPAEEEETDEEMEDDMEERDEAPRDEPPEKKVYHFEFDIPSQTLRELEDWEEPMTIRRGHRLLRTAAGSYSRVSTISGRCQARTMKRFSTPGVDSTATRLRRPPTVSMSTRSG